jgi:hypothetical protein
MRIAVANKRISGADGLENHCIGCAGEFATARACPSKWRGGEKNAVPPVYNAMKIGLPGFAIAGCGAECALKQR